MLLKGSLFKNELTLVSKIYSNPGLFFWLCLLIILMIGISQALVGINDSLTLDEPFTANFINLGWAEMRGMFFQDNAHPIHYVVLKLWGAFFGHSEVALRSFSVACFALTIITVGFTARSIGGVYAGLVGALLASISMVGLDFAGMARPYALLSMEVAMGTFACLHLLKIIGMPKSSRLFGKNLFYFFLLVGINVVALLTHPTYIFFMVSCNLVALFVTTGRVFIALVLSNALSIAIFLVTWGPILYLTLGLPITDYWMQTPDLADLRQAFLNLWGSAKTHFLLAYTLTFALLNYQTTKKFILSKPSLVLLSIILGSILLPFLVSQIKPVFIADRTPSLFFPAASIFFGLLVTRFRHSWLTAIVLFILVFGSMRSSLNRLDSSVVQWSPRSSVQNIIENAQCGDVFVSGGLSLNEVTYYMRQLNAPECIEHKVFPQSMEEHPGWIHPPGLLKNPEALVVEAEALAKQLDTLMNSHNRLYFFYEGTGPRQEVLKVLKKQLDTDMILLERLDRRGSFFDSVLVYAP